jgi:hypothetical protein
MQVRQEGAAHLHCCKWEGKIHGEGVAAHLAKLQDDAILQAFCYS